MSLISQSEFARRAGVTRQAIRFAAKEGKIVLTNGKVDTDLDINIAYLERNKGKSTATKPEGVQGKIYAKNPDANLTEKLKAIKIQREKNKLLLEMGNYIPTSLVNQAFDELKKNLKELIDETTRKYDEKIVIIIKEIIENACKKVEEAMNEFKK